MIANGALSRVLASLPSLVEATYAQEVGVTAATVKALLPGQVVNAIIGERLGTDRVLAAINGQSYNLRLPVAAEAGQTLQLEVVDNQPHLLFRLLSPQGPAAGTQSINLSATARWLQSANATLLDAGSPMRVEPLPLLQQPTGSAAELADNLRSALARSGMFYESHQALWVDGRFPLEALEQEPQATAARPLATAPGASSMRSEQAQSAASLATEKSDVTLSQFAPARNEASSLVERQLATLVGGPIEWYGQAWPGQDLHFSIQRDKEAALFADPTVSGWQTRLTLTLPRLGSVDATLHFSQAGVRIAIDTDSAASLEAIRTCGKDFIDTLGGLGIKVLGLGLHHG
jgi:hypothetical protein